MTGADSQAHLYPLTEERALWRWLGGGPGGRVPRRRCRPVGGGEKAWAVEIAADPRFAEAVVWQNRAGYHNAVVKVTAGSGEGSKWRRREEVIANYWQRYCVKNDTIGFFGPCPGA